MDNAAASRNSQKQSEPISYQYAMFSSESPQRSDITPKDSALQTTNNINSLVTNQDHCIMHWKLYLCSQLHLQHLKCHLFSLLTQIQYMFTLQHRNLIKYFWIEVRGFIYSIMK